MFPQRYHTLRKVSSLVSGAVGLHCSLLRQPILVALRHLSKLVALSTEGDAVIRRAFMPLWHYKCKATLLGHCAGLDAQNAKWKHREREQFSIEQHCAREVSIGDGYRELLLLQLRPAT